MRKIAQIYYYDPQSAGINLQSPQSDSTPWTLTLRQTSEMSALLHAQSLHRETGTVIGN